MSDSLLNILFKEEEALYGVLYHKMLSVPEYAELIAVQNLIATKGSKPKKPVLSAPDLPIYLTKDVVPEKLVNNEFTWKKEPIKFLSWDKYDKNWTWDRKTEFALGTLNKATPRELIDLLKRNEGNKGEQDKVGVNVYNVLSRYNKDSLVTKEEINGSVYYSLSEKYFKGKN